MRYHSQHKFLSLLGARQLNAASDLIQRQGQIGTSVALNVAAIESLYTLLNEAEVSVLIVSKSQQSQKGLGEGTVP